jgi:mono/diheme cytochrome c family protein
VNSCCPMMKAAWTLTCVFAIGFGAVLLSGCDLDTYPQELRYPPRTDPLVNRSSPPQKDASAYDKPGEFPKVIFSGLSEDEIDKGKNLFYPAKLKSDDAAKRDKFLNDIFGSPAHPKVDGGDDDLRSTLDKARPGLKLDAKTLEHGSELYRQHCLHCHGLSGDGRGPTAPWINPHPRDFRQGVFKFTSSSQDEGKRKPRREDLLRTVREGIEGTAMPAFRLIPDDDQEAIVSYVIHLSLRGDTEFSAMIGALDGRIDSDTSVVEYASTLLGQRVAFWEEAQKTPIEPGPYPTFKSAEEKEAYMKASVVRGFGLFIRPAAEGASKSAGCLACHSDFGRQSAYKYDYWGTINRPADLTTGIFRGGRRPIDLYYRIHSGVNGVTMPASSNNLKPDEIWDVVNFLQVLPYPSMREKYGIKLEQPR